MKKTKTNEKIFKIFFPILLIIYALGINLSIISTIGIELSTTMLNIKNFCNISSLLFIPAMVYDIKKSKREKYSFFDFFHEFHKLIK